MEPTFKDYFDKMSNSLNAIHTDIRANTTQLMDLVKWRPDLERRVDQLSTTVAELQQGRPATAGEEHLAGAPAPSFQFQA
ncbi:hypothetical protein D1007_15624 [Hordeum vulgare]|nr:hypothetical protein D1007_15624 [Hordeum vulgare]